MDMTPPQSQPGTHPSDSKWWALIPPEIDVDGEKPREQPSQVKKASKFVATNSSWWSTWIAENESEEASSIHASSFQSDDNIEKTESQVSRMKKASRQPKARSVVNSVMGAHGAPPPPPPPPPRRAAAYYRKQQPDLLALFQGGLCTSSLDTMKPETMQVAEKKLEQRLKKMDNPVLWSLINPESEDFVGSGSFESTQGSEYTHSLQSDSGGTSTLHGSSVLSTWSEEDSVVFEDLEPEIPFLRTQSVAKSSDERKMYTNSKYKELLNRVSNEHSEKKLEPEETSGPVEIRPELEQDPLLGPEKHPDDKAISEEGGGENMRQTEVEIEIMVPAAKGDSKKVCFALEEPIVSALSDETAQKYGKSFVVMASLPSDSKSCMALPPLFKNRFRRRRGLKLAKTESTASTSNLSGASHPTLTQDSACQDQSEHQAYVAFARRGKSPSDSIHLFVLDTAPDFPTETSEAVVKVDLSTVSPSDCSVRRGDWWGVASRHPLQLPIIPGMTFVGKIDTADTAGARGSLRKGDRVTALVRAGANSRYVSSNTKQLVKVPHSVKNIDAVACLPEIYLSAFQAIHIDQKKGRYRRNALMGKAVLILGGATALGRALIEVAVASGAAVVYATGRDKEFEAIKAVGGMPLSRTPNHWLSILTDKMDIVVGAEEPYTRPEFQYDHVKTLNKNGKLVLVTAPDQDDKTVIDLDVINERESSTNRKLHHYNVFDSWDLDLKQARRDLEHLFKLLEEDAIKPHIIERVPLSKVAKAQEKMDRKRVQGFTLCAPWMFDSKTNCSSQTEDCDSSISIRQSQSSASMDDSALSLLSRLQL